MSQDTNAKLFADKHYKEKHQGKNAGWPIENVSASEST